MSHFRAALLGPILIKNDDTLIKIERRKAVALLAYLIVTKQPHTRDNLTALFWPNFDANRGRAALRRNLYTLKAIFGDWLSADRESISLNLDSSHWCDVFQFESLLEECNFHGHSPHEVCPRCIKPLTEAVRLYRNEFLAGFGLPDSVGFDDWHAAKTQYFLHSVVSALERLVYYHHVHQHFAQATTYACRWMEIEPSHEMAHRFVMHLYATSGRRESALQQFKRCVHILDTQVGVRPQEQTLELYDAIRNNTQLPSLASLVSCIAVRHQQ